MGHLGSLSAQTYRDPSCVAGLLLALQASVPSLCSHPRQDHHAVLLSGHQGPRLGVRMGRHRKPEAPTSAAPPDPTCPVFPPGGRVLEGRSAKYECRRGDATHPVVLSSRRRWLLVVVVTVVVEKPAVVEVVGGQGLTGGAPWSSHGGASCSSMHKSDGPHK